MTEVTQKSSRDEKGRFRNGNACALKHGAYAFSSVKRVPSIRGVRQLKQDLQSIRRDLESCIPSMNPKKELLINQIIRAETQIRLIEMFIKKSGIIRPDRFKKGLLELQPALATSYLSFLNLQRSAIMALGLEDEKIEQILTPFEIVKNEEKKNSRRKK